MPNLKMLEWNMEWMNDLFVSGNQEAQFRPDNEKPQHGGDTTIRERRDHLSGVINELAPDFVVVVEGPSLRDELQLFFSQDVAGTWEVVLQTSPGQSQNIGLAVRTDTGKFSAAPVKSWDTRQDKSFDPFLVDTDNDDVKEQHKFERRPLYVEISPQGAPAFRILGLHLKSKGIFDAYEWSKWWEMADANRKKILAQANQIRTRFLDPYLSDAQTKAIPLLVCGDINDGPGLDASEKRLFGSGIERLMGSVWRPGLCLGNALFEALKPKDQEELDFSSIYTTSFRDPIFNNVYQREWIDHILYSKSPAADWVQNAQVHRTMPDGHKIWEKYKHASDHFPVSVEIHI
jgi:endonuclease/exonuclease/phosphatase family metal-dependent hydrolase